MLCSAVVLAMLMAEVPPVTRRPAHETAAPVSRLPVWMKVASNTAVSEGPGAVPPVQLPVVARLVRLSALVMSAAWA